MKIYFLILLLISSFAMAEMVDFGIGPNAYFIKFPGGNEDSTSLYAKGLFDSLTGVIEENPGKKLLELRKSGVEIFCRKKKNYVCYLKVVSSKLAPESEVNEIDGLMLKQIEEEDSLTLYNALRGPNSGQTFSVGYQSYITEKNNIVLAIKRFSNGPVEIFCSREFKAMPICKISYDEQKNYL